MAGLLEMAKISGLNPAEEEQEGKGKVRIDTTKALNAFFENILKRCASGEDVHITGFGTFKARIHKGRTLKSPLLEGGEISYDDLLVLRFSASASAKRKLNSGAKPKKSKKGKKVAKKGKKVAKKGKKK